MKLLDKYIFAELFKRFILFLFVVLSISLFEDAYNHLEKFLECHVRYGSVFKYYCFQCVALMPLILPISFFLAIIFTFCTMHARKEITAYLAAGISFFKITRSFWSMALALSIILLLGNLWLIPLAQENAHRCLGKMLAEKNSTSAQIQAHNLGFNGRDRLYYIEQYDKVLDQAQNIAIYEYDLQGNYFRRIAADLGKFDAQNNGWTLYKGQEIFLNSKHTPESIVPFTEKFFRNLQESPEIMLLSQEAVSKLSFSQLKKLIQHEKQQPQSPQIQIYKVYLSNILLFSFLPCLLVWAGLPLLFSRPRESSIKNILKFVLCATCFLIASYILSALGVNNAISWATASLLPFALALAIPLFWIKKML